jgi:hypothetical protein
MYFKWPKLQSSMVDNISIKEYIATLIEHNGPLLYITKNSHTFFLNYMIDEDEEKQTRRFLHVPISHMKLRALVTQGIPLRDCLQAENLYIYDLDRDSGVVIAAQIEYQNIDDDALPNAKEYLPQLSDEIIDVVFGFKSDDVCFILSGRSLENHSMSFDKLSKFLIGTQQIATEATNFYCEQNTLEIPSEIELRVTAPQAASFAINTRVMNDVVLDAISTIIPEYTERLLTQNSRSIYSLLDTVPVSFAQSLFEYYKLTLRNHYESIIKIKNKSFYLNIDRVKQIKKNVNDAKYIREEVVNATGYLVGGNIKTNYFYFIDKESKITYRGRISEDYSSTHNSSLTLSDTKIRRAKFNLSTKFRFGKFEQIYELLELSDDHSF